MFRAIIEKGTMDGKTSYCFGFEANDGSGSVAVADSLNAAKAGIDRMAREDGYAEYATKIYFYDRDQNPTKLEIIR